MKLGNIIADYMYGAKIMALEIGNYQLPRELQLNIIYGFVFQNSFLKIFRNT